MRHRLCGTVHVQTYGLSGLRKGECVVVQLVLLWLFSTELYFQFFSLHKSKAYVYYVLKVDTTRASPRHPAESGETYQLKTPVIR